jgi:hypothetical protein
MRILNVFLMLAILLLTACSPLNAITTGSPTATPSNIELFPTATETLIPVFTGQPTAQAAPVQTPPNYCTVHTGTPVSTVETFTPGTNTHEPVNPHTFDTGTVYDISIWGLNGPVFLDNSAHTYSPDSDYAMVQVSRQVNPIVVREAQVVDSPKIAPGIFEAGNLRFDLTYTTGPEYYKIFQVMTPAQVDLCNQFPDTHVDVSGAHLIDGNYYFNVSNDHAFNFTLMPGFLETLVEQGAKIGPDGEIITNPTNPNPEPQPTEPPYPGGPIDD